ncbi:MAG: hypothetical protein ABIU54_04575, partial [Candidatus Eisenbacteria bacterium]
MLFSEADQELQAVPPWVDYFLGLGYGWQEGGVEERRIALVSMPCDSPAAGLVALGALVRDLANPRANDAEGHFDSLLRYARQYLRCCRRCRVRCDPAAKGCGYTAEASGHLRRSKDNYIISTESDLGRQHLVASLERKGLTRWVNPRCAADWGIDGEPPPKSIRATEALSPAAYASIVKGAPVTPENLRTSFSGLCFAGRASGEAPTRQLYASTRLQLGGNMRTLADLLTIHA